MRMTECDQAILRALEKHSELSGPELLAMVPKTVKQKTFNTSRSRLAIKGLIKVTGRGAGTAKLYGITPAGKKIINDPELQTATYITRPPKKKKIKSKDRLAHHLPAANLPAPAQPPALDISYSADALANTVSEVIRENAAYRDLMLRVVHTIADALGLQVSKVKDSNKQEN